MEALTARIERLERANRRLTFTLGALLLGLAAVVLMAFGGKPRVVEAEKIIIRDSHGHARLTIGTPRVVGAAVDMGADDPGIWLADENGIDRVTLAADGLYFADGRRKPVAEMRTGPERPSLRFHGPDGTVSWSAP